MRQFFKNLLVTAVVFGLVSSANAASMQLRLVPAGQDFGNNTVDVGIEVMTDTPEGVKGLQVDILSVGTGSVEPVAGVPSTKAKHTWNVSGFSFINPNRVDAQAPAYPSDTDTDLDALGASMFDATNFTNTTVGVGGWTRIATQQWQLLPGFLGDFLQPYVIGAQYYDFTNGQEPAFAFSYPVQNVTTTGLLLVPEPASFVLAGLSIPALVYVIRRRTGTKAN
jgi:hypothetical protein